MATKRHKKAQEQGLLWFFVPFCGHSSVFLCADRSVSHSKQRQRLGDRSGNRTGLRRFDSITWLNYVVLCFAFCRSAAAAEIDTNKLPAPAEVRVDFVKDIKPLLDERCLKCHSDEKPKSHFRLTNRDSALKGGDHGIDIIPGDSARSPLIRYVARLDPDIQMPPEDRGILTPAEVGRLRAWIDQGVAWGPETNQPAFALAIAPAFSWTSVSGDKQKFRELSWQREEWIWGLDNFEYVEKPGPDSKITVAGHVLRDDYKLTLNAEKNDLGFTRFGWEQFRKYFDDSGGYNPQLAPFAFELNRDLHLDVGRAWAEVGLTLPRWPRLVVGYEYRYRDGTEATTQWGPVRSGIQPGSLTNNIYPGFKDLFERVHVLKFDADYEIAGVSLSDNFRGEWYRLSTSQVNESGYTLGGGPVDSSAAFTLATEQQSYFQGANTFHAEKQFTDWLFGAGGYLYSKLDASGSMAVENSNPNSLNSPSDFFPGYIGFQTQRLELGRESHVFSLSGLVGPWEGLGLNFATQNEWTRERGLTVETNLSIASPLFGLAPFDGLENLSSDLDRRTFSQEAGLRFTKLPFTTLYAEARFEQDDYGQFQEQDGGITPTPFVQKTDAHSHLTDLRAGFNTSPWRRVSLSGQYRRYDNRTDYNNLYKYDPVFRQGFEGYPAFIRSRELLSDEAEGKLALQLTSWLKTSLTYQWLANEYHTGTDPVTSDPFPPFNSGISPGGRVLAGTYNAHIATFNATLTPWRRLFLSTSFSFQNARTVTSANYSASVAPYAGDIYSVILNGNYTLDARTSLVAAYSFSRGDFSQDNGAAGLPLGLRYAQHTLQAGMKRRLSRSATLGLDYRYYRYDEPSGGGFNDFQAHAVFGTLAWRWP